MDKLIPFHFGHMRQVLGCIGQSVTCLTTDACLTANPGVQISIPARYHTLVAIDYVIISMVIVLLSTYSRRVVVSNKRK